ncbi:methylamine utilization protein [Marinobacter sp. ATCH36]|uniref:methylamine utilization protein n=1 Tax=Marinobacter sp. ATCH36 TaxID=2945106 RepID=UPI0020221EBB|nr:methylamine utilization protein [Marinobacter sp. ATCH36]MCL7942695.1 methylamine utilization protein [Marinobacter sp. ATCH36]
MYRLTVALAFILASAPGHGTETTLELTDTTTGQPVADAIVILENGPEQAAITAEIVQKNREFQPRTLVIPEGSIVHFPNRDNTQHHVYSFSPARIFNIELYAGKPEEPIIFDQTGVVEIGCNIHDHMQAFILVTDSAPAGRTDEQGRLIIELPQRVDAEDAGLLIWHPRLSDNTRVAQFSIQSPYPDTLDLSLELSPEPATDDRLDSLQKRFREL